MKSFYFLSLFATSIFTARSPIIPLSLRMSPYAMLHDNSNYFNKRSGFRNIINPATLDLNEPIHIPGSMMNGFAGIQDFFRQKGEFSLPTLKLNEDTIKKPQRNPFPFMKNFNF